MVGVLCVLCAVACCIMHTTVCRPIEPLAAEVAAETAGVLLLVWGWVHESARDAVRSRFSPHVRGIPTGARHNATEQ